MKAEDVTICYVKRRSRAAVARASVLKPFIFTVLNRMSGVAWQLHLGGLQRWLKRQTKPMPSLTKMGSKSCHKCAHHRGFSLIEMVIAVAVGLLIAGMAIPTLLTLKRNLRIGGDAADLNGEVTLAKMRAASDFTRARVYADLAARTFRIEVWNKAGAGSWGIEGGTQPLSQEITWGFGTLNSPPPGTQAALGQAPLCLDNGGAAIANTACITFNSRGIPVDPTGAPTPNDALYLTGGGLVYGVTVSATGLIQTWRSGTDTTYWKKH